MIKIKRCEKCSVHVVGRRDRCPLCQAALAGEGMEDEEVFPQIPTIYRRFNLLFRILIFVSITAGTASVVLNMLLPSESWWSLFVLAGIASMWIAIIMAAYKQSNISKSILYQVVLLSVLATIADGVTGWHRWSIDYVIPAICLFGILTVAIIAIIMYRRIEDYYIYLIINGLLGIIPLVLVLFGIADVAWPALILFLISVVTLSGMTLFTGIDIKAELKKRFHI